MSIVVDSSASSSESEDEKSFGKNDTKHRGKFNRGSRQRGNPAPCPICGVVISNSYNLTCHLRRHNNDKPFKCDQCPSSFILITELKRHKISHSKDRPFKCTLCPKSYKCIEILRIHMDSHGLNEYKCRYCDEKFKNYKLRGNHEMSAHTISNLKCRYCYKSFSEVKFREDHEKAAHKKQLQSSELCKVGVKSELMNLTESEITNLELNEIKEQILQKKGKAKRSSKLTGNLLDTTFAYYPCKFCPERFRYRKDQVSHYQEFHVEEFNKVFTKCHICFKLLTTAHFKGHLQAHNGIFSHNCSLCDYKSTRKGDLDNHMLVHTKEYKYKCSICQKQFRALGPSLLCEKKHAGKKDVKCNLCEKTFFSGFDLRRHVMFKHKKRKCQLCDFETTDRYLYDCHRRTHIQSKVANNNKREIPKSCMCDICGLLFKTSRLLTSHLKVHNIPKDNSMKKEDFCFYCNFKGTSHSVLLDHCLSEHPSKVIKCEFCGYSTIRKNQFLNHMKHHMSNSAQDMYVRASIEKKHNKDISGVNLECFVCGFSSSIVENMHDHIESHTENMKTFEWYCPDTFYQRLKDVCPQDNSDKNNESFLNGKKYKILQIKDISLPVDFCRLAVEANKIKNDPDVPRKRSTNSNVISTKVIESSVLDDDFIDSDFGYSIKAESQESDDDSSIIEIRDVRNVASIKSEVMEPNKIFKISDIALKKAPVTLATPVALAKPAPRALAKPAPLAKSAPLATPAAPVTIKIKKIQCKTETPSIKKESDLKIESASKKLIENGGSPQVNLNLEILKNKLQNINGKLFLSLEDLCSLSTLKQETIFQL